MFDHQAFVAMLPAYLNGTLTPTDTQRMDKALEQNPQWQHDVAFERLLQAALRAQPSPQPPELLWQVFRRQLVDKGLAAPDSLSL